MSEIKTYQIEVILRAVNRRATKKEGDITSMNFIAHPQDVSEDFFLPAFLGKRFVMVLAEIDDDDQPVHRKRKSVARHCGMMCQNPIFQEYMANLVGAGPWDKREDRAARTAIWVRKYLDIPGRKVLDLDEEAAGRWWELYNGFAERK